MRKIVIYQIFTRLFGNTCSANVPHGTPAQNGCGKFDGFTDKALEAIKELGATHVWYTGVLRHATRTAYNDIPASHPAVVKGQAGSPYSISDYYDVDPDLAVHVPERMQEFESLVARTHKAGLKVIIDFVPNHVARQYRSVGKPEGVRDLGADDNTGMAFDPQNNFYYLPGVPLRGQFDMRGGAPADYAEMPAKATGNDRFDACPGVNDWYDTVKLNYGVDYQGGRACFDPVPDTWQKMLHILLYWADKKVDGFRCDMAEMVPVEFWQWAIAAVKKRHPKLLFIAEIYNPQAYRRYVEQGGFDYLYDKVGLYDTLRSVVTGQASASSLSAAWQGLAGLEPHMLNFLENHDEQRIASDFFSGDALKARPALLVAALMNTNPLMIYAGQELGEPGMDAEGFSGRDGRTTIFDYWSPDTLRRWCHDGQYDEGLLSPKERELRLYYCRVLKACRLEKAVTEGQFFDLTYANINGWRYDAHRQYAFLRKWKNELLLVAVNFSDREADVAVNLPSHAFDFLQIPQKTAAKARDLLTGAAETISLLPYRATDLLLPAYSGKVLKIKL